MKLNAKALRKRLNELKSQRTTWESHWREIADYMRPNRNDVQTTYYPGQKRNTQILDNTGMMATELLAGALHSMLMSPNMVWFQLKLKNVGGVDDDPLFNDEEVRKWLQESTHRMIDVFTASNFHTEAAEYLYDLCSICTAGLLVEEDDDHVVRFSAKPIKGLHVAENSKGIIDEVYREFEMTARQLIEQFGSKSLPDYIVDKYKSHSEMKFAVVHAIYPLSMDPDEKTSGGFKFISQYMVDELHGGRESIIKESGFNENPYIVSRWEKTSDEVYGRGPGVNALPEVRLVNRMTETIIKASQKVVDPPLQVPDDGYLLPIRTTPAGLNFYRAGTRDRIEPILNNARLDIGLETLEQNRQRIREAFYIDQLQLRVSDRMTATEVMQRTEENERILAPLLARQRHEFLKPLVDRVFNIMMRKNLFPEVPEQLVGRVVDVQYASSIARSQQASEVNAMMRTLELVLPVLQMKPEAMDLLNEDGYIREIFRRMNFPIDAINTTNVVNEIREGRAEAQQQMIEQQQAQQEAEVANKAAGAMKAVQGG